MTAFPSGSRQTAILQTPVSDLGRVIRVERKAKRLVVERARSRWITRRDRDEVDPLRPHYGSVPSA
jgi:hypothetical protein